MQEGCARSCKENSGSREANVRAIQTNVRYTTLTAPFGGTIGISQVKVGTPVYAGQTILNTISSNDHIAVVTVPWSLPSIQLQVDACVMYRFARAQAFVSNSSMLVSLRLAAE